MKKPGYETSPNEKHEEESKPEIPLGFITEDIPPGAVVAITRTPITLKSVRLECLVIPEDVGAHFKICGLTTTSRAQGDIVLLPIDDEISAAQFAPGMRKPLPDNEIDGGSVTLRVRNTSSEKRRFMGVVTCTLR